MHSSPVADRWLAKLLDLGAGCLQGRERTIGHRDSADRVEQHAHGDAVLLTLEQRREHLIAEGTAVPHENAEVDAVLRVTNGLEQRRHEFVTILKDHDATAMFDRRANRPRNRRHEVDRSDRADFAGQRDFVGLVVQPQNQNRERRDDGHESDDEQNGLPPVTSSQEFPEDVA